MLVNILVGTGCYVSLYLLGYWWAFKDDYQKSGRSMIRDVAGLQLIEQTPNLATLVFTGTTQAAAIQWLPVPDWMAANLASWFGPQKIIGIMSMIAGNSFKKAWVDGSWNPISGLRDIASRIWRMPRNLWKSRSTA